MDIAKYSNFIKSDFDPDSIKEASKGNNAVCVLAIGANEPQGQESVGGKVTKVILENYIRRPSLKEDALQKITEFAHDAIAIQQKPSYPVCCSFCALLTQGDQFRWVAVGDVRVFHFLNGQIVETNPGKTAPLGTSETKQMPELISQTRFQKGEHAFLVCSGSFCRHVQEHEIENALSMAENADDWLRALKDLYEERTVEEPFALLTIFVPEKKKRLAKGKIIAIVVAIVVLLAGVFFGLGAARRGNQPRPPIPGQQVGQPGVPPTEPPGPPEGEAGGIKPTQPPAPTEPPVTESTEETADS